VQTMSVPYHPWHKCDEREFDECDGSMHVHVEVLVLVYAVVVGRDAGELRFCHYVCTSTPQQAACAQNAVCVTLEVVRKLLKAVTQVKYRPSSAI
jgi:hypothetical protein